MGATLLPNLATEIFIPLCAVIGIAFALFQWLLVSNVKLSAARDASSDAAGKNGFNDYLIEEKEGINDHNVVQKCTEIQNAISEDDGEDDEDEDEDDEDDDEEKDDDDDAPDGGNDDEDDEEEEAGLCCYKMV